MVGSVHEMVFPAICYISKKEDRELLACTEYLQHKTNFGADQLGLSEDFCIPLPAAVVELASLDQRTTPLDREFYLDQLLTTNLLKFQTFIDLISYLYKMGKLLTRFFMKHCYKKKLFFYQILNSDFKNIEYP